MAIFKRRFMCLHTYLRSVPPPPPEKTPSKHFSLCDYPIPNTILGKEGGVQRLIQCFEFILNYLFKKEKKNHVVPCSDSKTTPSHLQIQSLIMFYKYPFMNYTLMNNMLIFKTCTLL